ncbi:hypothetical protein KC19_6G134500 [Ceratodon purpureus]|uniref:Uncharacterized protein n=1 Tax=Ceratodon purpureus TaxID=3225 RepID=A0A8T0HHC0_CERPU|nr:hypothetical protein KC19_6G134500 [Ceratodon purpureus]
MQLYRSYVGGSAPESGIQAIATRASSSEMHHQGDFHDGQTPGSARCGDWVIRKPESRGYLNHQMLGDSRTTETAKRGS